MDKTLLPELVVCDLDGVVWLAHEPIPGSAEALNRLAQAGVRLMFVTNASFTTVAEVEANLRRSGITGAFEVVTSAMAAATVVTAGSRVLLCGGRGLHEELTGAGCQVTVAHEHRGTRDPFDAVVVGLAREFDYEVLADCMRAVRGGARLIGSNDDNSYPTPDGPVPGGGALLAAISVAAGVTPVVTGKPHPHMVDLVLARCGGARPERMVVVGDKVSTDGRFARALGCHFVFVLSGVDGAGSAPADCTMVDDLRAFVTGLLG